MKFATAILVAAATFGICFLADQGFIRAFRGQVQHQSGLSVRLNKRYGIIGLILVLLGILAICVGITDGMVLLAGGIGVLLMGAALIVYYLTFGVFYDADSFILSTFGKKARVYRFADIRTQQLYTVQGGNTLIELHLSDGKALSLQADMDGTFPFLDHAFAAWCRQTGADPERCPFHDPANSLWFPMEEA